jgi:hypothetical protein
MRYDFVDYMMIVFMFIFFGSAAFGCAALFGAGVYHFTGISCTETAKMQGLEGKYTFASGCMVKISDKQWILSNDLIVVERDGKFVYTSKYAVPNVFELKNR